MRFSSEGRIPERPSLFRALGRNEPPPRITAAGGEYAFVATLKHDSWAATARYRATDGTHEIVCKFGRRRAAGIGRFLARRERRVYRALAGCDAIARLVEPVAVDGVERDDAIAHEWVAGAPFTPWTRVDDRFFPRLASTLASIHARGLAHADMAKWENILVDEDGSPWLLDFQIHLEARRPGPWRAFVRRVQAADRFYLQRHWARARPDQQPPPRMPWSVWTGELAGAGWRAIRILILRVCGVPGDPRRSS